MILWFFKFFIVNMVITMTLTMTIKNSTLRISNLYASPCNDALLELLNETYSEEAISESQRDTVLDAIDKLEPHLSEVDDWPETKEQMVELANDLKSGSEELLSEFILHATKKEMKNATREGRSVVRGTKYMLEIYGGPFEERLMGFMAYSDFARAGGNHIDHSLLLIRGNLINGYQTSLLFPGMNIEKLDYVEDQFVEENRGKIARSKIFGDKGVKYLSNKNMRPLRKEDYNVMRTPDEK